MAGGYIIFKCSFLMLLLTNVNILLYGKGLISVVLDYP